MISYSPVEQPVKLANFHSLFSLCPRPPVMPSFKVKYFNNCSILEATSFTCLAEQKGREKKGTL